MICPTCDTIYLRERTDVGVKFPPSAHLPPPGRYSSVLERSRCSALLLTENRWTFSLPEVNKRKLSAKSGGFTPRRTPPTTACNYRNCNALNHGQPNCSQRTCNASMENLERLTSVSLWRHVYEGLTGGSSRYLRPQSENCGEERRFHAAHNSANYRMQLSVVRSQLLTSGAANYRSQRTVAPSQLKTSRRSTFSQLTAIYYCNLSMESLNFMAAVSR